MFIKLADQSPTPIIIAKEDYITYMNQSAKALYSLAETNFPFQSSQITQELAQSKKIYNHSIYHIHKTPIDDSIAYSFYHDTDAMQHRIQLYENILDKMEKAIYITDAKDRTLFCNEKATKIDSMKNSMLQNTKRNEYFVCDKDHCPRNKVLESGQESKENLCEYCVLDGNQKKIAVDIYPYHIDDKLEYIYTIYQDIKTTKETISNNTKRYHNIIKRNAHDKRITTDNIIGSNLEFVQTKKIAARVAENSSNIMIYGETGTGKELFAQSIHNQSLKSTGPFVSVNCAAIPDTLMESIFFGSKKGAYTGSEDMLGLFEQAHNGTLFLDEINSMNILLQAKLLRVLQEKKVTRLGGHKEFDVNCRIISSLNKDPFESIQNGKLRDDLFYRLSTVILEIPPLRERKNDLDELTLYFIKKYNEKFIISITGISDELNTLLSQYDFPGNVRELQHMMESAFNLADPDQTMLEKEHLPKYILRKLTEHAAENISNIENIPPITIGIDKLGDDLEKKIIVEALIKNHYNVSQSAKELDISRQKLQYRIKKHQIPIAK